MKTNSIIAHFRKKKQLLDEQFAHFWLKKSSFSIFFMTRRDGLPWLFTDDSEQCCV
jgi:hypothetical protein